MITGFGNNVISSLAADITAAQTTIQVMPGTGAKFAGLLSYDYANASNPLQTYAKITLTDAKETVFEICHLTSVNNDVLTVVRGQEGTTAKGWALNDVIANFATRGSENQFVQIEQLQSGHYISGVAGGTANALTLELPATYFVNGATGWTLRTPIVVYPTQNNTGPSTLQLTMGGRVLGAFKLYKGNKTELVANDIQKDVGLMCLLDNTKTFFNVTNPGAIYAGLGTAAYRDVGTNPGNVMEVGAGRLLAGTFISDAADKTSIGARAATGCQFMRAHQSPDAPDQVNYWQIITLTEVVSPTSVVDVLAISGNNVLFGHGTGAGITSWRHVAMLEGAAFTGDISAPNMHGSTSVTVGDGTGGIVAGSVDGAGFNGNNLNIKSWNGIGFLNSSDGVTRAYISTKLGVIAASDYVYAGDANLYKNGDVYGNQWSTGSGPSWLSLFLAATFPSKTDVSVALAGKPDRVFITHVGVYNNDKTKPFMLHDDNSGIFLAPSSSVHLDANGWHRDASTGLITQWGSGNVAGGQQQRVNFPMTFPNTCVTVVANDIGSGTLALSTMSKDTGGFTVKGSSTTFGFNWFSMGY